MGPVWDYFGTILEPFWDQIGIILEPVWDHFGIILGRNPDLISDPEPSKTARGAARGRNVVALGPDRRHGASCEGLPYEL